MVCMTDEQRDTLIGIGGKLVSGLSGQPLMLSLVVLQLITIGAILYSSMHRQDAVSAQIATMADIIKACVQRESVPH
jgi:hypothetical protein